MTPPDYFETVRQILKDLPGVEESTSYGTPSFKVKGKFLTRLKEDGESLVVKVDFAERDMLIDTEPDVFYITDHYRDWPSLLVHLSRVDFDTLERLLLQTWRRTAPKTLLAAFEKDRKA